MSIVLPQSINYAEPLPSLPDGVQCISVGVNPVTGNTTYSSGQILSFDLLNRGFLVPDSLYIAYKYTATTAANAEMIGCPVYTSFNNLSVQVGSQTIETIQNYNVVMNMLTNLTLSVSEKYGQQYAFGYNDNLNTPLLESLDGRLLTLNEQGSFSAPLMCVLSNSEKLLPLFAMPQIRINLTIESLTNMFTSTVIPTGWTLSNVELRYKVIDMGGAVEDMVRGMGDKIYIKSQSFASSSQTLAANSSGYQELIFNSRFASVKSLFAINGNGVGNKQFDSVDLTNGNGEYSFAIGGQIYPQRPISTVNCKALALQELRSAVGSIFDKSNAMSINSKEFLLGGTAAGSTYQVMAKFYVACSTEKIHSNNLLTGISTQNSPISYRLSLGSAIGGNASTITLVVNYDALFEVDMVNRQCALKT